MLIRSQDKELLFNFKNIAYLEKINCDIYAFIADKSYLKLGGYADSERTLQVLDEVQRKYVDPVVTSRYSDGEDFTYPDKVFQMPRE